ncbi:MAG: energy-coupling factor transporter transmembrane protein EcfT [Chloroflexi bacterium]|nr:energy-coupling factor transporter transmembrane protein EcfT [Chloroflexota bacterium]
MRAVGTWGHLAFLVWAIVLGILAPGGRLLLVLGLVAVFSALFFQGGLRPIRRLEFWALVASAVLLSPFLIGEKDLFLCGLSLSRQGFWAGLWMALRALSVALAVGGFAYAVSVDEMAWLFEMAGLKGLGFAVGVAVNMLPTLEETARNAYDAMRLRGGFQRERLQTLRMLLVTVIVNALRRGDEVVEAAEARAFRPDGPRREPLPLGRADLILIAVLMALGVGLLAWP